MPIGGLSLCSRSLLARGQSALAPAPSPAGGSAGDLDVFRLGSLLALGDVELDLLPFLQAAVAAAGDRAEVHEHVRATVDRDEAIAFVAVEPLHSALRHLDLLLWMRRPAMAGAALATCFGQPATERAGWKRCGWLTGRSWNFPGSAGQ